MRAKSGRWGTVSVIELAVRELTDACVDLLARARAAKDEYERARG